jgi:lysophospholipase L1-like esterase
MQWGKNLGTRRRRIIAISAAALMVVGAGGFVGHRALAAHRATEAGCERVTAWKQQTSPYQVVSPGDETIAILGDSYSAGDDLADRSDGWVHTLAHDTGARVLVNSVGYTGYTAGGYCGNDQFSTRIDQLANAGPNTLIIQGGLNDVGADPDEIEAAATDLLRDTADIPNVVLVGPPHAPQRSSGEQAVDRTLSAVARQADVTYVSAYAWDLEFNEQGLHLTEAGHRQFAHHVEDALAYG